MQSLKQQIESYQTETFAKVPQEVRTTMMQCTTDLKESGVEDRALKAGDSIPDFELPNQHGEMRRLYHYLAISPVVLNIYRGGWCPYCNLEMQALGKALPEIEAKGARLIGMSPETPSKAETTADANGIAIDILSDSGNKVSEKLGLVFELPEALRPIYRNFGLDLPACNGDDSFRLPVPATYIIRRDGIISYAFVNADYTRRMEPAEILQQLDSIWLTWQRTSSGPTRY